MAKALLKKGRFEIFCSVCRSRFTYEYPDTYTYDGVRYVECIVCKSAVNHTRGIGNTA